MNKSEVLLNWAMELVSILLLGHITYVSAAAAIAPAEMSFRNGYLDEMLGFGQFGRNGCFIDLAFMVCSPSSRLYFCEI